MPDPSTPRTDNQSSARLLPVLLYDGTCGLCARSVQWVLTHEGLSHALQFATLDGVHGQAARARHPELGTVDSVVWVTPQRRGHAPQVLVRSDAVLAVLAHLGGGWAVVGQLGRRIPRSLRDTVYRFVARYRLRVFGRDQSCLLPTAEQRARFID